MTIALGILARSGAVVAADTQETLGGYWKTDQGKVRAFGHLSSQSKGACLVSAAGSAGYCDSLMDRITQDFKAQAAVAGDVDLETHFGQRVHSFHMEHVAPFGATAPEVSLVIAAQRDNSTALWGTERSAITRYDAYTTIGIGGIHAAGLLNRLWSHKHDVVTAAIIAAYVIYHVKEHVDGCGKSTHIALLSRNRFFMLTRVQIRTLEQLFDEFTIATEPAALRYVLGAREPDFKSVSRSLRKLRREIVATSQAVEDSMAKTVKAQGVIT